MKIPLHETIYFELFIIVYSDLSYDIVKNCKQNKG